MFLLCEDHFTENKKSKWNNYCSLRVRKSLFHIILEREYWKLLNQLLARRGLKKAQKGWLCGHWKAVSFKLYPPLCMYYRTLLEWFLTEFLQSKYVWLCFYWWRKKENIAVIINASYSSSEFYFSHFVGAEDIPQSCMLSFSSQNQILGFLKLF